MNDALQMWMERASVVPGILGCGVLCADRSIIVNSLDDKLPVPRLQNVLQEILDVAQTIKEEFMGMRRLSWTFENGRIFCVAREDGVTAVLLVSRELKDSTQADRLLSEVLSVIN